MPSAFITYLSEHNKRKLVANSHTHLEHGVIGVQAWNAGKRVEVVLVASKTATVIQKLTTIGVADLH